MGRIIYRAAIRCFVETKFHCSLSIVSSKEIALFQYGALARSHIPMCQPKLRRGVKSQPHSRYSTAKSTLLAPVDVATSNNDNSSSKLTLPKRSSPESPGIQAKYFTRMPNSNVTKHFVSSSAVGTDDRAARSSSNNPNNRHSSQQQASQIRATISSQSRVIENYLNQTLPITSMQTRAKCVSVKSRSNNDRALTETVAKLDYSQANKTKINPLENHRPKSSVIRSQTSKSLLRYSGVQKPTAVVRGVRTLNAYSQSHGVITASAYKDLRNSTIRW